MTGTPAPVRRNGYPGYTRTGRRASATAAEGRELVRAALSAWELDSQTDTAVLLMSELVTNAVRHAHGSIVRMTVNRPADDWVRVAVVDTTPHRLPQLQNPDPGDEHGRGLVLIEALADRWGYDFVGAGHNPWGKCVWAELQVSR
ncbi:ATP-binding protein [Streptomyces sp. S.PB5]|jgi:anti-sigma regulatory factor (Ser/Thr protein kinase)|uniref:ATP-binding protein n=1 Tax=Streptomyces sp. S.PB5 TaxID=3020844 RepID=UPI0025AF4356|nr:ATP-binding protein [Streptomyces sp. S.PB5]MDN3029416.1 ATP-binding protein [Streptomyces sp. S.PB5]